MNVIETLWILHVCEWL